MKLPAFFKGFAASKEGIKTNWQVRCGEDIATCCIPVEFGGPGLGFSPEDFFLQSLINCFIGTFKVSAELSKISYQEIKVEGNLTVNRNKETKQILMQGCFFKIFIQGAQRPDRVRILLDKVMRSSYILNSVKTNLSYELNFID